MTRSRRICEPTPAVERTLIELDPSLGHHGVSEPDP